MRILLINPRSKAQDALPIPPLGILYLAAYVRERGFTDIKVIDDNRERLPKVELYDAIHNSDILGLTGTTSQYVNALELLEMAHMQGVPTVYGGPHASALPLEIEGNFDWVVVGEGEQAFLNILAGPPCPIYYPDPIKDLDTLPFPARDLVPIRDYPTRELKRFDGPYTHMITGRGCSGKCIFCSSPKMWGAPRLMSADRVFQEMLELYEKYGFSNIHFQDDTFTLSKKRIEKLCTLIIESRIDFKWSCQTRPDMVDYTLLRRMKEAGCVQVEYGIESGDSRLLKTARKGYDKRQIKESVKDAKRAGLATYGFFIIGLPGESIISWLRSIRFALLLKLDSCVWTVLMPFPGTEVYEKNMVEILDSNYANWLYKRPIIKVGKLGPRVLTIMRNIADTVVNGLFNKGTYRKDKVKNES